ncbi:DNA polymerase Y family protein [Cellvibrio sp. NN19]|uniref:Y-family DNA polymerase n=1 Tax=Cellvibrio chitinivorans TaxID=3102792 RepID=UPI002B40921B|nr:DNA polymerase Y family protein [Cellvibrio sp. NN19]
MSEQFSRLWLAIRCSDLPLSALEVNDPTTNPVVVIESKQVIFANPVAEAKGARIGMDITSAQLLTGCVAVARDHTKEAQALHTLSEQLYQFTPYIETYCSSESAESGVLLEISSCLRLFGGIKAMTEQVVAFMQQTEYVYTFGLAHSAKAAWYLSFADWEISGAETKSLFIERLNQLPIDLLVDYPKALEALHKTGFRRFGDIATQIQGNSLRSFTKRMGQKFSDVLCEIYDIDQHFQQASLFQKPRDIYQPDEWFEQEIQFDYPVAQVDQLKPAIESLLQQLCDYLRKRQQQCQHIRWTISDIYREKEILNVHSDTPQSHWQLLFDLSIIQFDNKELLFEVDTIKLLCEHTLAIQTTTELLDFEGARRRKTSTQDFALTIAKLKARLGEDAVYKLGYSDKSRVPELNNITHKLLEKSLQNLPAKYQHVLRPTWLLTAPELMEQRNERLFWNGYVSPLSEPERIIGNWWDAPVARDYYLAKRHDHLHLWIFFNLYDKKWYVHGVFA